MDFTKLDKTDILEFLKSNHQSINDDSNPYKQASNFFNNHTTDPNLYVTEGVYDLYMSTKIPQSYIKYTDKDLELLHEQLAEYLGIDPKNEKSSIRIRRTLKWSDNLYIQPIVSTPLPNSSSLILKSYPNKYPVSHQLLQSPGRIRVNRDFVINEKYNTNTNSNTNSNYYSDINSDNEDILCNKCYLEEISQLPKCRHPICDSCISKLTQYECPTCRGDLPDSIITYKIKSDLYQKNQKKEFYEILSDKLPEALIRISPDIRSEETIKSKDWFMKNLDINILRFTVDRSTPEIKIYQDPNIADEFVRYTAMKYLVL